MPVSGWFRQRLSTARRPVVARTDGAAAQAVADLTRAHGQLLALIATILEREGVIAVSELAEALAGYAKITAIDAPAEGRILAGWAAHLEATPAAMAG